MQISLFGSYRKTTWPRKGSCSLSLWILRKPLRITRWMHGPTLRDGYTVSRISNVQVRDKLGIKCISEVTHKGCSYSSGSVSK